MTYICQNQSEITILKEKVAGHSERLLAMTQRLERNQEEVSTVRGDVRELIVELKNVASSLDEVVHELKQRVKNERDLQENMAVLLATDTQQQKTIDGLNVKAWGVISAGISVIVVKIVSILT